MEFIGLGGLIIIILIGNEISSIHAQLKRIADKLEEEK